MSRTKPQQLSVTEKVGYGLGDLASNLFWQMFAIFIAKYYTDVFLLSAATMGTMLLLTRIVDAICDPVIGAIADRTRTRWGHFRPYLLWMSVPMALTAVAAFTVPDLEGTAKVVYAYVTLSLMGIMYAAINVPYSALLGVLTPDSDERTSASGYRFVMALLPVFVIVNSAIPMATYFGGSPTSPRGWQMTMIVYAVVAVLLYWATFAMTTERVKPDEHQRTSLAEDVKDLSHNRPWVVLCVVGIAALIYANIRGTVAIYYFENVVPGGKNWFGPVMTTGALAFIAGVIATAPLSRRFGKRNFYMASMAVTALLTAAFYFVPPDNLPLVWGAHALISLCAAPTAPLVWAMYADTADYAEWKWNHRATGLVFSAASLAQKFGWAIGGASTGWLLAYFGYQPNVDQSARAIEGITMMMSVIPTAGALVAMAALWFYELDEPTVEKMTSDLKERRARQGVVAPARPEPAVPMLQPFMPQLPPKLMEFILAKGPEAAEPTVAAAPQPLPPHERAALDQACREILRARVHGLCFSPYLEGQAPGVSLAEAQIRARLEVIGPFTRWVRTFSCTDGQQHAPRMAHAMGLKTLVGAWIGRDRAINEREIEGVISVARAGHADLVCVGNEVMLREDLSEDELIAYIGRVRQAVPGVPVGYADAYFLFEKHPRIVEACDVVFSNCYPFWEGCPGEQALVFMRSLVQRTRAAAPGKRIVVSETGWPDQGSAFRASVPSADAMRRFFVDTMRWAEQEGIEVFWFAAFDESWKVGAEGDVGGHWGLWDKDGVLKFG